MTRIFARTRRIPSSLTHRLCATACAGGSFARYAAEVRDVWRATTAPTTASQLSSIECAMARLGAPTPTPAALVLVPIAPHGASHAASTRLPSCRAIASRPLPDPGLFRSAPGGSTIYSNLLRFSPCPIACVRRDFDETILFLTLERRAPRPGPNLGPLALPSPAAAPPGCGPLEPASAVAPAPFTASCAALTRFCLLARAGSFLRKTRS